MSSHCGKYPSCNCPSSMGLFCHLDATVEGVIAMNETATERSKQADFERFAVETELHTRKAYGNHINGRWSPTNKPPHKKHATNYTPPKKRHRK